MDEHDLLIRHAAGWATTRSREMDETLLRDVLSLRDSYDDLPPGTWPPGSAERLLLTTWPAYGDHLPELDSLRSTLDTFWSFLRATGRMNARSASPAELRKEAKRALPKMRAAYDDPARHSTGRVLSDFGESVGIPLDGAESIDELQGRLDEIQQAWNALPQDERFRLMPDASPKSNRGALLTSTMGAMAGEYDDLADVPELSAGDPKLSARDARESGFVQQCVALADWVGDGKQATARGLLRPAVAREAYQHLGLWAWKRAHQQSLSGVEPDPDPEADALRAETAARSWRSAGDCLALDRLWFSLEAADLVAHQGTRVRRVPTSLDTDQEVLTPTLALLIGLCRRLGSFTHEPLAGALLLPHVGGGSASLSEVRDWWDTRCPEVLRDYAEAAWSGRLDWMLFHFADCNLWWIDDDQINLTDLGNDFAVVYLHMLDEGLLEDD